MNSPTWNPHTGSAFPLSHFDNCTQGMSFRAYVATQCLTGMLANVELGVERGPEPIETRFARAAVDYADALIAQLARNHGKDGAQ